MQNNTLYQQKPYSRQRLIANKAIRDHRRWYIFEGLLFIAIGMAAMMMPGLAALTTEMLVGSLLVIGGLVRFSNGMSFPHNRWRRIISGLALTLAGGFLLMWPGAGLAIFIAFLGALLLVEGAMEITMAISYWPARHWGWLLISGIIALALGGFILTQGMATGMIFIAFIIGISLTLYGISLTSVALNAE